MKDFPEYSFAARGVLDLFVMDSVSTIFYFEDDAHESVYERLLEKLIPNLRRFAVVCLGGKSQLISKAREPRAAGRISIFIADKDFDDLLGLTQSINGLYYLEKHCFENYFLNIDALKLICVEENPLALTNDRANRLMGDKVLFLNRLHDAYEKVTRLFLVIRKYGIQRMETTKMSVDTLLEGADQQFPVPTDNWCANYRRMLKQNCHERETSWLDDDVQLDIQLHNAFVPKNGSVALTNNLTDHLNGKHMFRCLVRYVQSRLNVDIESMDTRELYLRVLSHLNLADLNSLKEKIIGDYPAILQPA